MPDKAISFLLVNWCWDPPLSYRKMPNGKEGARDLFQIRGGKRVETFQFSIEKLVRAQLPTSLLVA